VEKQREIARAYSASEELLREKNVVALNGLMTEAVKLLENDAALREKLQTRFAISWWMNFRIRISRN